MNAGLPHRYATSLSWSGSTGVGYADYDRTHQVTIADKAHLGVTADAPFLGDGRSPNPEELLLAAASSCQLLSFLAVAARARVDVLDYRDEAHASMPQDNAPMWVSEIVLRPVITLADPAHAGRLPRLVEVAHRECFIAATVRSQMTIHTRVLADGVEVAAFVAGDEPSRADG